MIRIGIIAIALSIALASCNGQVKKGDKGNMVDPGKPETSIKVNKHYDKNGNLINYDSTYSYYYSNVEKDSTLKNNILKDFKSRFNQKYFFSKDPFFNDFFFQDSLLKYDFYRKDFFMNRFRNNVRYMDSLFLGMDSLKNNFFNQQFKMPGQLTAPRK